MGYPFAGAKQSDLPFPKKDGKWIVPHDWQPPSDQWHGTVIKNGMEITYPGTMYGNVNENIDTSSLLNALFGVNRTRPWAK